MDDTLQGSAWRLPLFVFPQRRNLRASYGTRREVSVFKPRFVSGHERQPRIEALHFCPEANLVTQPKGKEGTQIMLIDTNNKPIQKFRNSPIIQQLESAGFLKEIEAALQGSVYAIVRNHKKDDFRFALRDVFGGPNWEWSNTPLYPIWEKCLACKKGDTDAAYKYSARIAGFILKNVLIKDRRTFKQEPGFGTQSYSWVDGN